MSSDCTIVMADVTGSRKRDSRQVGSDLTALLRRINRAQKHAVLSPFVTTLGDEFQGLVHHPKAATHLVFAIEDDLRSRGSELSLRYVIYEGGIETPINRERAYGMLGPGLTEARALLTDKSRGRARFAICLRDVLNARRLGRIFSVLETLFAEWKPDDYEYIQALLAEPSDAALEDTLQRDRTSIYRRRQTLRISDYLDLRALAYSLATQPSRGGTIAELRKLNKITQAQLARNADLSAKDLSRIEREARVIDHEMQRRIDFAFGFDLPESDR